VKHIALFPPIQVLIFLQRNVIPYLSLLHPLYHSLRYPILDDFLAHLIAVYVILRSSTPSTCSVYLKSLYSPSCIALLIYEGMLTLYHPRYIVS